MSFKFDHLRELVKVAMANKSSDIHIRTDEQPCFRISGKLVPIESKVFKHEAVMDLCKILTGPQLEDLDYSLITEIDGGYEVPSICRLRYNIMKFQNKFAVILRIINLEAKSIDDLRLPRSIEKISLQSRGLVLITGATGSGKSSTLTAMIDHINHHKRVHIVTLEDPVEFVHKQKLARITQRDIGKDTNDYKSALRSALRQDPDIISIGEMRDIETISTALKAAETGHLVLGTVHTTDAISTINRLIGMFPMEEQENARKRLADNLYATISQRLLPRSDNKGMVPAVEIMINSSGIRECILGNEDLIQIYNYIKKGKGPTGSQSFDQHIEFLLRKNKISRQTAVEAASSSDFVKVIEFE